MKYFLIALLLSYLLGAGWAQAESTLQPRAYLQKGHLLAGDFYQTRTIHILPLPLVSEGSFSFRDNRVLVWVTREPVKSRIEVYLDKIVQISGNQERKVIGVEDFPLMTVISSVFYAMFGGDYSQLQRHFLITKTVDVKENQNGKSWSLLLMPANSLVSKFVKSIRLQGSDTIEVFLMEEPGGDSLRIDFSAKKIDHNASGAGAAVDG